MHHSRYGEVLQGSIRSLIPYFKESLGYVAHIARHCME